MRTLLLTAVMAMVGCGVELPETADEASSEAPLTLATVTHNRALSRVTKIEALSIKQKVVELEYTLAVYDTSSASLNLTAALVLTRASTGATARFEQPTVVKHGAIQCNTTCAGTCPGLINDGTCSACSCSYKTLVTVTTPAAWNVQAGETLTVQIVPSRGGVREHVTTDDIKTITVPAGA